MRKFKILGQCCTIGATADTQIEPKISSSRFISFSSFSSLLRGQPCQLVSVKQQSENNTGLNYEVVLAPCSLAAAEILEKSLGLRRFIAVEYFKRQRHIHQTFLRFSALPKWPP